MSIWMKIDFQNKDYTCNYILYFYYLRITVINYSQMSPISVHCTLAILTQ